MDRGYIAIEKERPSETIWKILISGLIYCSILVCYITVISILECRGNQLKENRGKISDTCTLKIFFTLVCTYSLPAFYCSYLWTYDLYGPVHNSFDAGKSIQMTSGAWGFGSAWKLRDFFGPCEMASSNNPPGPGLRLNCNRYEVN